MAKDLKEQIEIMTHYLNGGEIECADVGFDKWGTVSNPLWNWSDCNYRIKEQKQKVTIEKWLFRDKQGDFLVIEISNADNYKQYEKVKLIESYEVEF